MTVVKFSEQLAMSLAGGFSVGTAFPDVPDTKTLSLSTPSATLPITFQDAVKLNAIKGPDFIKSALGALIAIICGLLLWKMPLGEPLANTSYDYLFRFDAH